MKELGTESFRQIDTKSCYAHSFGPLAGGTCYYNPFQKGVDGKALDLRSELRNKMNAGIKAIQSKALTSTAGGTGTAGYAMVPVYVDPRIVDTTRKYTPLVEMIPRVTNIGRTADYNKITAKGAADSYAEGVAISEDDDTYDRASVGMKYLYAKGRVTGQSRATYPSYILEGFQATGAGLVGTAFSPQSAPNAKQLHVIMRARALREFEENLIINGNNGSDATEYDGIIQTQSTTNKVDKNTTAVDYDDTETAIQYAFDDGGRPNLAVCSSSVLGDLRKIMIDTFRYRPVDMTTELPFGVSSHLTLETMVGPIPVIPSMNLSNTTGSKAIYFLDMNYIEMRVLQDMTYEDKPDEDDSQVFLLKIYEALVMKNTAFNSFIGEIS